MIYCPECGTANREGSRFCNNCGSRLHKAEGRPCPMCGKLNPMDAQICQYCEARLTPLRTTDPSALGAESVLEPEEGDLEAPEAEGPVPEEAEAPAEGEPEPAEETPLDWLQMLRQSAVNTTEAEPSADEATGAPGLELPSWLNDEDEAGPSDEPSPLPSYLEGSEGEEPEAPEAAQEGAAPPDWLREIISAEEEPAGSAPGDVPPLWAEEAPGGAQPEAAEPSPEEPLGRRAAPQWLLAEEPEAAESAQPSEPAEQEEPQTAGSEEAPEPGAEVEPAAAAEPAALADDQEGEIPDWLKELAGQRGARPKEEPLESFDESEIQKAEQEGEPLFTSGSMDEEGHLTEADVPDWLRDLAPSGAAGAGEGEERLAEAEIPDWLRELKPRPVAAPEPEERPEVGQGVLTGISGVLPIESVWRAPQRAQAAPTPPPLATEEHAAEVFADILAAPPKERRTSTILRDGFFSRAGVRLVIYLIMAAAVIVPLFIHPPWLTSSVDIPPAAYGIWDAVQAVQPGGTVLMDFDFDPTTAAELDLQAQAILNHLMDRGAQVIALSLVPTGPALAQHDWEVSATGRGLQYGQDFINLGYLAGQESGLRLLTQGFLSAFEQDYYQRSVSQSVLMGNVKGIQDLSLVILLSGDMQSVVRWVEQIHSAYPTIPMVAGVSGLAGPDVLPYYNSGQLAGLIIGLPGAAQYELASNQPSTAVSSLGAQSLGHLAIIAVIVLGNLAALGNRIRRRK